VFHRDGRWTTLTRGAGLERSNFVKKLSGTLVVLAASLFQPAYAGDNDGAPRRIAPPRRIPDVVTPQLQPAGDPVATASIPKVVRRAVVADAARRFEVPESAVVLTTAEQVTWSDGSLGCPVPGRMYTQALVSGYRVVASTAAGKMRYHTDERGNVATCDKLPRPRAK
jgi:hypothetical protein